MNYFTGLLLGLDQFANVVIGGSPDETLSAHAGRLKHEKPYTWGVLAAALNKVMPSHTSNAIENEEQRLESLARKVEQAEKEQKIQ